MKFSARNSRTSNVLWFMATVMFLGQLTSTRALAQTAAQISGSISDSSGAIVPNANVTALSKDTGVARSSESNAEGFYTVPLLQPGNYMITVKASGFATQVRTGVTLDVGAQQVLNFTLQVGQVTEKVEVTGAPPAIQLSSSSISAVVSSTTVRELPLNGRDWTQLATLQPAVTSVSSIQLAGGNGGSFQRGNRGLGSQMAISGTRPQANNYRIDGINVSDDVNNGPGGASGITLGVDGIQEFSVITSNYSAEYGRTAGGVINATTRSGTNQFHGGAFEFLRNSALDAANFFDNFNNRTEPPFRRNQFGGSAGGPIRKDRTFVFGDYEGFRQFLGQTITSTVPSLDARNGTIYTKQPNGTITSATVTVDPKVVPFLALWPAPNGQILSPGNTGIFSFAGKNTTNEDFASARIDHRISDKDSIFGSWQVDKATLLSPDVLNTQITPIATYRQFFMVEESHTFTPALLNSFRAGYNRYSATNGIGATGLTAAAQDPSLGAVPGLNAPVITVGGGVTGFVGGLDSHGDTLARYNSFQAYDDVFYTKGIHSLKFGFAVERDQNNWFTTGTAGGTFKFGSLTNFLINKPTSFAVESYLPSIITERGYRQTILGGYLQDDARLRPNLTVNIGFRYEMSTVPTEVQGKLGTLHNPYNGDPTIHLGDPLYSNPTLRDIAPRVGFAWDPFHSGKTSVRGGFGLFDTVPLISQVLFSQNSTYPFYADASTSSLPVGSFPSGAFALATGLSLNRTGYVEQDPHRSYVMQWNLSVERELKSNLAAMIAYVGSHGVHQVTSTQDINGVLPTLTSSGYLYPFPAGSGTVIEPKVGRIDLRQWNTSTVFDALEVQVTKRMSHGFQVQGSYTWSKALDEGTGSIFPNQFTNSLATLLTFAPGSIRGLSDFSISQNLVVSYLWNVPTPQSFQGPAKWVAQGWQFGGILTAQTGLPFTPILGNGGDPLGEKLSTPFDFPNRLTGPGCQSVVNPGNPNSYLKLNCFALPVSTPAIAAQCTPFAGLPGTCANLMGNLGRNSVIGPGLANFDFSLFKNNPVRRISENFNVQFRAEFFNVFNRANFVSPIDNENLFSAAGVPVAGAGLIDLTSTTAREIQFAIKLVW